MKAHNYIVLDTETGGLDHTRHSIIEVAAQFVEIEYLGPERGFGFRYGTCFHEKCKPTLPVSAGAAAVNGYTEDGWAGAQSEYDLLDEFFEWVRSAPEGSMWCGSNPSFDLGFIEAAARRCNMLDGSDEQGWKLPTPNMSHRMLNTASLCTPLMLTGEINGIGLKHLRKWAGLEGEQQHRALADVHDTVVILSEYLRHVAPKRAEDTT